MHWFTNLAYLFTNLVFLFFVIVVASILLGNYLARLVRMPEYGWKLALILFAAAFSVAVLYTGWPPKRGVDLSGGVILVYEVDPAKRIPGQPVDMDKMIQIISKRVNPSAQKDVTIRPYGGDGLEITIPFRHAPAAASAGDKTADTAAAASAKAEETADQAELDRIKSTISEAGTLEFRILANNRDHRSLIERAQVEKNADELLQTDAQGKPVLENGKPVRLAWWVPISPDEADALRNYRECAFRQAKDKNGKDIKDKDGRDVWEVLVAGDDYNVTGDLLRQASAGTDRNGQPCVKFSFRSQGAQLFSRLTSENLPDKVDEKFTRKLGIILNHEMFSAPSIQSTISDEGEITGSFTEKQVDDLVSVLNAGSLPAALTKEPISQRYIGATLGSDTIRNSARAMLISAILVPLFMLWYYRFAGVVANVALVLNMVMLVAIMVLLGSAFTLPGLAGLALTVGMAVDNNVLIYERLREELRHGAALRMAIRNAFHRAGTVIIDANVTHLMAATVLWSVGTDQIKGFAITFWLGAVLSLWTSLFVARVIFEIAERRQWITKLKMLHVIGETKIDFMDWFPACATFSVLITIGGLAVAFYRGVGLFDIDFTGGVSIEAVFRDKQGLGYVRTALDNRPKEERLEDLAVNESQVMGETAGRRFIINTSERNLNTVEGELKKTFGDKLITNDVKIQHVALITATSGPEKPVTPVVEKPAGSEPATDATAGSSSSAGEKHENNAAGQASKGTRAAEKKPAEIKSAEKVPAEVKPAEKKPAEKKPAESKPAEKKHAEIKADEKKPAESEPAEKKPTTEPINPGHSRNDLPSERLLAMGQPVPLVLAQATEPAKNDAKPIDEKTAVKPADEKAAAKPVEDKPAAKPAANKAPAKPLAEKPLAEKPAPAIGSATAALIDPYQGGSRAEFTFDFPVNHATAEELLAAALQAQGLKPADAPFALSLPTTTYLEGDVASYPTWVVSIKLPPAKAEAVLNTLAKQIRAKPYFAGASNIGGAVAEGTRWQAAYALMASWVLIILYLWIRFQGVAFGLAAVIALIHDVLVMLGAIAVSIYVAPYFGWAMIEPFKINLPIVAAFLTIIGYSVNDTIVVFDRIREVRGKAPRITRQMINDSTNQTLSRTLLTSFTVFLVVVILYWFGGQAIHGFAFALIVGVATGTYSSIYVAAPILLWLVHPKEMKRERAGVLEQTK